MAALVAVAAVGVGLSLYAGAIDDALEGSTDRALAEPTLDRVHAQLAPDGVVQPERLGRARAHGPTGFDLNLTLRTGNRRWAVGPPPDQNVRDRATRAVSVRVGPTDVRPGRLRAVVLQ